ncbi:MAG TPA: PEGA domain-containing protein [Candidatus Brocadiaceae bacterium]
MIHYSPGKKMQCTESNHSGLPYRHEGARWVKLLSVCMFILLAFHPKTLSAVGQDAPGMRKAAIFVENRAGNEFNEKVSVMEDFLTSRITEKGFSILSREVLINSLQNYSPESEDMENESSGTKLDKLLSNNTSALRLAQMMGADYIIVASIASVGTEKKVFGGYGVETVNLITNLRASYKILDALAGGTLVSDTIRVSKTVRSTGNSQTESSDTVNELLDNAAVKIAENLSQKQIAPPPQKTNLVEITISCGMQDLAQLPISVPDVRLTENQKIVIENNNAEVQVLDVTVELNGTVIGSAPGVFKVSPGLNKIRLSREGFKEWERTINITNGQSLKVALQMTDAGYKRWKDNTDFLYLLKKEEKLTEAEVERIKGIAQMFRQSGFKVDTKEDIKGKTKSIYRFYR